jgi:hypothetical protein
LFLAGTTIQQDLTKVLPMKTCRSALFPACAVLLSSALMLAAAVPDDQHWDNQFGPAGLNGSGYAIAVVGQNVFAGGASVTAAGNTKASGIAGFDGTNWFPLNAGLLNLPLVLGMGVDGHNLYVGGIFTNADDPTAHNTARWDGTNWSGIGIQGVVYSVKRSGANLYFAGTFSSAGGVAATNVARWDGTNWFALGLGVNGPVIPSGVDCMAVQGNIVYVGGTFAYAGTVSATNVAYFDGSVWHAMGNPFAGTVTALIFYGPYLYAGGVFTNLSLGITNIARWDGSVWSAVPGGSANQQVEDFATDGTNLFVGGYFTHIGGIAATGIVSFDGSNWSPLGGGVHGFQGVAGEVNRMVWSSNQLYVAGGFERAGNVGAYNVARWDGSNWWSLGNQTSKGMPPSVVNRIYSLLSVTGPSFLPNGLYAGGGFGEAGDAVVNNIGMWNGTNWNPLGTGVTGVLGSGNSVHAMATDGTYLYAGGYFTNAGVNLAANIAYWDGTNWWPLGSGVDWIVNALVVDNYDYLYVGGGFTNAGGVYSRGLAEWVGGSWYNLGNVEGANGAVYALAFDGSSKIYAGGSFFSAGGAAATNIAYFNNSDLSWHSLDPGFNAKVNTVAYGNGMLYAGGSFTKAGNLTVNHVAQWDGTSWSAMGGGITGGSVVIVNSIFVAGTNVYVTGNFTNAGGVIATNIAIWNGANWSAMGSGLDIPRAGFALAASGNDVFVGGNFTMAGDKPAQFISRWNNQSNFYPAANIKLTRTAWLTNKQVQFRVTGTSGQSYIIQGSTNLTLWTPLQTNSTMFYDFSDTNSSGYPSRFYRAVLGP